MLFLKVTIKGGLSHNTQSTQVTMAEEEAGSPGENEAETQSRGAGFARLHMKSEKPYQEICSPRL